MAPRFAFVPARWLAADSGLNAADRLTLCILCQWVNRESGECFPSVATIAIHSKLSANTIRESIKRLVEVGALTVEYRREPNGDPASNLYTVLGYDPPRGTANQRVPPANEKVGVLQTGGYGTANEKVEVPQTSTTNVVKENKEVNTVASASAGPVGPPRPLRDLQGTLIPDVLAEPATPPTDEERSNWRHALSAAGVPERHSTDGRF